MTRFKLSSFLLVALLWVSVAGAQVPARSIPSTCMRDDTLSTLSQAEGTQVPCRVDSIGATWVNMATTLDEANDSITIYGSDDGGTTKRLIKTDTGGAVAVDIESAPSLTIGTFPDNEPFNLNQIAGTTTATGNGVVGAGVQRVAIASDNTAFSVNATLSAETTKVIGTVRNLGNAGAAFDAATGAAPPANAVLVGGLTSGATGGFMRAINVCDDVVNVNVSTATTTLLVTGVSGRHVRICSMNLVTAAANNVALISGTGATCGTGTTGMNGGTSAASGWNFAANGGLTQGSGIGTINRTNATGDSVCVVTSAATQLSGRISYAIW